MTITLAITGGTGFVGRHLLRECRRRGHTLRALTRRPQPAREGVTWIRGHLADERALAQLVEGADAVVHMAGLTNADDLAAYRAANATGTASLRAAAPQLPFLLLSSLAAREPDLSLYGASKRAGEDEARRGSGPLAILRPPAVYGPGDTELLALFEAIRFRIVPLPAGARASMIHVGDLAEAIAALAEDLAGNARSAGNVYEIDDGHGGYRQADIARAMADVMGVSIRPVGVPPAVVRLAATAATLAARFAGRTPRLSRDRARYLTHPDWTANCGPLAALGLWAPRTNLSRGLAETVAWYRGMGWL